MSKVKKHIQWGLTLLLAAVFALNCGRSGGQTKFSQNMEADSGKPAPTYEEWVALIGQQKADTLYAGIGQDSLNILTYGIGISNLTYLINNIAAPAKLVTLIGNDFVAGFGPGSRQGLGAIVTLSLLKAVDGQMQTATSSKIAGACSGLAPYNGGTPCGDDDTIMNLASVINTLPATDIDPKLVQLFGVPASTGGFKLARNMSGANDALFVGRMAKVIAHVDTTSSSCASKLCPLITGLSALDITDKLAPLMSYNTAAGIPWADKLVETMERVVTVSKMVTVISGVSIPNVANKMTVILDTVSDCTKMGYTIETVGTLATLVNIINNVSVPGATRLGQVINQIEDSASYTTIKAAIATGTWVGGPQSWGSPVANKANPWATAGTGAVVNFTQTAGNIALSGFPTGSGYHTDVSVTTVFTGCPTIKVNLTVVEGVITGGTIGNNGGCTIASGTLTLNDPVNTSGMKRLVDLIDNVPAANYFQILSLVDSVTDIRKLVVLIQDGKSAMDLVQTMNGMTPLGVGTGCNGTLTVNGGTFSTQATAVGFVSAVPAAGSLNYIAVTNGGAYTAGSPPTGVTDGGCGVLTAGTAVTIVMNTAGTQVTGIYLNALPTNSMAELVQNLDITRVTRLREVLDGQRIFNNTGTQTSGAPAAPPAATYLGKMVTLIGALSQQQEGPIKVTQMINGVTNTDKIIDLIYDVTDVTNLANIINGIFSASINPPVGCTDSFPGYLTQPLCDQGATTTAGNGFIWGDRSHAVDMLVYTLENIVNTQNLVAMVNGASATQVKDLINHVSTGSQLEDLSNTNCGTCAGAPASSSTKNAGGAKLVKILDYNVPSLLNPYDLAFVLNRVGSTVKMAKLINLMQIGQSNPGVLPGPSSLGAGKIGDLVNRVTSTPNSNLGIASTGNCYNQRGVISVNVGNGGTGYTAAPVITIPCDPGAKAVATITAGVITAINITDPGPNAGNTCTVANATITITPALGSAAATGNVGNCQTTRGLVQNTGTGPLSNIGKGKIVNMIKNISAANDTQAMQQLADLMNGVDLPQKLGDMVNRVQRSSNVVALLNAVLDSNNNTSTTDLKNLLNGVPVSDMGKLIALIGQINSAIETPTDTLAAMDQDLIAQLMAPVNIKNASSAVTFTNASANIGWAGHPLAANDIVVFTAATTLAPPLVAGMAYFVSATNLLPGSFQVSASAGGTPIVMGGTGTGVQTATVYDPSSTSGVGVATMTTLMGSLTLTNGINWTGSPTLGALPGGATGAITIASGQVTAITITNAGSCTTQPTSITLTGGGGGVTRTATVQGVWMPKTTSPNAGYSGTNANRTLKSLYVTDGGAGYSANPTVTFTGGTCPTPPVATANINGLLAIDVVNPGSAQTANAAVTVTGTGSGVTAKAIVAGGIATLGNFSGGSGFIAGTNCPIMGAGGSGGVANVTTVSSGAIATYTIPTAGADYRGNQVVSIGGAARAHAIVDATGAVTSFVMDHAGCGYTVAPTLQVLGCTGAPTGTPVLGAGANNSSVASITFGSGGSGCPKNPRVMIIGGFAGNASGTVATVTPANSYLAAISLGDSAEFLANILTNANKAPLLTAVNYLGGTTPNISAREAFVRLLYSGISYSGSTTAMLNSPGIGPSHLGKNMLSNPLMGFSGVQMVLSLLNSPGVGLESMGSIAGCLDGIEYEWDTPIGTKDWQKYCNALSPTAWVPP